MKELLRTNDMVTLSFVEALLRDSGIPFQSLDHHTSILEGSLGVLPRRILVDDDHEHRARQLMIDAGLEGEAVDPKKS